MLKLLAIASVIRFRMRENAALRRAGRTLAVLTAVSAFAALAVPGAVADPPASFGTEGSGAGQISEEPRGIAIDQKTGDVYISDRNNFRIERFGPEGEFQFAWGWGVVNGAAELQVCGPEATPPTLSCQSGLQGSGVGAFGLAEGIAVDNSAGASGGDVYVLDAENSRIEKFAPDGEFLLEFGETGSGPGQFTDLGGRSIAVGSAGGVYVADLERVQKLSPTGAPESEFAIPGAGPSENLAVDSGGDIYLKSSAIEGVRKYSPSGSELGAPRDTGAEAETQALAIGPADELLVNDLRAGVHHLLAYDGAGVQVASFDAGDLAADAYHRGITYSEASERVYVLNAGKVRLVPLPPPGPLVLPGSESATEIDTQTANLNATINPEGGEETSFHFEYGTEPGIYGQSTPSQPLGSGEGFEDIAAAAPISGLSPRTTYHFRIVATNKAGETVAGPDQSFQTLPPVSIESTSVSAVTATGAILETTLNPHGLPSHYHFEYDTTPYLEGEPPHGTPIPVPDASAGSSTVDVIRTAQIQGLQPGATYHFRVVADNELGRVEGPDRAFITQSTATSLLPDGRAWEMVTPVNKHGFPIQPLADEGAAIQAPAACETLVCSLAYVAKGPLEENPSGARSPAYSQFLASRGAGGWVSEDLATRTEEPNVFVAGRFSEYKVFSAGLERSVVEPIGATPLSPAASERTPYLRNAEGAFVPLVNEGNVPPGTAFGGTFEPSTGVWQNGVRFDTASPDLRHLVLVSPSLLTDEFAPGFEPNPSDPNLYEYTDGSLTLVSVLPDGEATSEAGLGVGVGRNDHVFRGAVSDDGSRLFFFTQGGEKHLYMRDIPDGKTLQIDAAQSGAAGGSSAPFFQGASADGSRVFFVDTARLTPDATASPGKPDLYLCEIHIQAGAPTCGLSDLSVDPNPGEAAKVAGGAGGGVMTALDRSGDRVFFVADGVLTTTPNSRGEMPVPGECEAEAEASCNLYTYDVATDRLSLVAVLSNRDDPDWAGRTALNELGNLTARVSPDGHYFTFMSQRSLTGYDNRDAASGEPDEEVYLYDVRSDGLRCVSCNPTGGRPRGVFDKPEQPGLLVDRPASWGGKNTSPRWLAASIPGWTLSEILTAQRQPSYLADSGRLFFTAADALVPQDANGLMDVYEFEPPDVGTCTISDANYNGASGGCISLISSGTSGEESAFLDATESGSDVFLLTASRLSSQDIDGALDIYDAHVCSGGSPCIAPPSAAESPCSGEACQAPGLVPLLPGRASSTFNGPGNTKAKCPRSKARKGGRCVKKHVKQKHRKHRKPKGKRSSPSKRAASTHRRVGR